MSAGTKPPPSGIDILDRPVTATEKAAYVQRMFDDIAPRYDLLNDTLSVGIHHSWRAFATRCASLELGDAVLDVCTGTGVWTPLLRKAVGTQGRVVGVDFSGGMLRGGRALFNRVGAPCVQGDATRLPFADGEFDAATVAFGIRNVGDIEGAFREMARVVRPGGRVVCLEFAEPKAGAFRALYRVYSRFIMPTVGGAISGRRDAYTYLPASVARFQSRPELAQSMRRAGLEDVRWVDLTFGLVCVHVGVTPGTFSRP
ncbi:MAG: bifunctional demethylmenaquinone methyltransferase/2-methoxy-6-polyprenyl-1,4-benzoquinol methylase UbiE [Armatimonadota bacterium]|nr:bifunctional demethylmenaquinone methyltransferase/2-methoxy-6-polyprenyl-1,4-benzoquinol methylase UbiE [Armatimonadota bacterium]